MFDFPPAISGKLQAKAKELLYDKLEALGLNPESNTHRVTVKDFPDFENYWEWHLDKGKATEKYLFSMFIDVIYEGESSDSSYYVQQHLFDEPMTQENKDFMLNGFKSKGEKRLSSALNARKLKTKW